VRQLGKQGRTAGHYIGIPGRVRSLNGGDLVDCRRIQHRQNQYPKKWGFRIKNWIAFGTRKCPSLKKEEDSLLGTDRK